VAIKTAALALRLVLRATSTLSEKCDQMLVDGKMMRARLKIISLLISYGEGDEISVPACNAPGVMLGDTENGFNMLNCYAML
jgi:hypothetical protein